MIPAPPVRIVVAPLALAAALTLGLSLGQPAARAQTAAAKASADQAKASAKSAQAASAMARASRPSAGTVAARSGINKTPAEPVSVKEDVEARSPHSPQEQQAKVAAARAEGRSAAQKAPAAKDHEHK